MQLVIPINSCALLSQLYNYCKFCLSCRYYIIQDLQCSKTIGDNTPYAHSGLCGTFHHHENQSAVTELPAQSQLDFSMSDSAFSNRLISYCISLAYNQQQQHLFQEFGGNPGQKLTGKYLTIGTRIFFLKSAICEYACSQLTKYHC